MLKDRNYHHCGGSAVIIWSNLTFIANCEKTNNFLQNCSLAENKLKIDRANFDLSIETTRKIILKIMTNKPEQISNISLAAGSQR